MISTKILWIGFNVMVAMLLMLDLFVFNRNNKVMKVKEALWWSLFWIGLAVAFNVFIYFNSGSSAALQFLTGYLIEESLSVDNLFVFILLFSFFETPVEYQRKVLFWGIIGAVFFRAIFILFGFSMLQKFHWITYIFGAFLIYTAIKMFLQKDSDVNPEGNPITKVLGKIIPVTTKYHKGNFFAKIDGRKFATPLLVALIVVETTDIVFALDSIPAVLAVTPDAFIAYSSNIFAILGLRALYFALEGIMRLFHYLHYGLSLILLFIGVKLVIGHWVEINTMISLSIVGSILIISIIASLLFEKKD